MKFIRSICFLLMVICLIYSVSIYMVGSGTFSFVIWLAGAAFFGLVFFLAGKGRWMKVPAGIRRLCYCFLVAALIVFVVCMTAMLSHFGDEGVEDLDYIVVLGAQMRETGPSVIFKYRLDAAYEYLLDNPETICIVSGGQGKNESVAEGDGGKAYLVSRGIDAGRVIAETKALDTTENIRYSLDIIGQNEEVAGKTSKIGIVTNNFHVFRGIHLARKFTDMEVYGIAAYTVPWYLPNNMVRECFGIIRDFCCIRAGACREFIRYGSI